jgi:hypothetical protein
MDFSQLCEENHDIELYKVFAKIDKNWKIELTSKNKVCAWVSTKIIAQRKVNDTDFCWRSGNSVKRKTTPGQPNPGIPLFRRHS